MMISVDKHELESLVESYMTTMLCQYCDCRDAGLCDGHTPEGGCVSCYLKYLQIDQEKA